MNTGVMSPRRSLITGLFITGLTALAATAWLLHVRPLRPSATGDVGQLETYAQLAEGPTRLWPDRLRHLPRPQALAFWWTVDGTGPRVLRVEVETGAERFTAYERVHDAPAEGDALDYILRLDERFPDRVDVWVTIEAPHASAVTSRFPLHLVGPSHRFWEPEHKSRRH